MAPEEGKQGEATPNENGHTEAPNCHRDRTAPVNGQGRPHGDTHYACPYQHNEGRCLLTDEEIDLLIFATATGRDILSETFSNLDVDRVLDWARGARISSGMLALVMNGQILPVGVKEGAEIGFRFVTGTLSQSDAAAYRAALRQIHPVWPMNKPPEFRISGDDDPTFVLGESEKAALQLALETAKQNGRCKDLELDYLLRWGGECLNDAILLGSILVGDIVPDFTSTNDRLDFRSVRDLPAAKRKKYHDMLKCISAMHEDSQDFASG